MVTFTEVQRRSSLYPPFLLTGIAALDKLLAHGIAQGLVTEICGLLGSGRSSLLLQIAAVNLENPNVHVIFVDFKRDIYLDRLQQFLKQQPWGCIANISEDVLPRVSICRFTVVQELIEFVEVELEKQVQELRSRSPTSNILLLIDNLALPFKWWTELQPGDMIAVVKRISHQLRLLTSEYNLYTVVTNSMTRKLDLDKTTRRLVREYHVPSLGKPWLETVDTRIVFEKCGEGICARSVYCWCDAHKQASEARFKL